MSEHLDTWIAARALIAKEETWCQGTFFRDTAGSPLVGANFDHPAIRSSCLAGAMWRAAGDYDRAVEAWRALAVICQAEPSSFPSDLNDHSTHAEVLALLDRGIAFGRASRTLPALLDNSLTSPAPAKELA